MDAGLVRLLCSSLLPAAVLLVALFWWKYIELGRQDRARDRERRERARRNRRDKAYIVGTLDLKTVPPRLAMVGIYSASADQLTTCFAVEQHFDISWTEGDSFQEARDRAEHELKTYTPLAWALYYYEHPWDKEYEYCWHCGDALEPQRPHCEKCPAECDVEGCEEPGCCNKDNPYD